MEVSREIILVGPQLLIFGSKNRELLEIDSFLPSHIYLGSWQITTCREKIIGTLGDALSSPMAYEQSSYPVSFKQMVASDFVFLRKRKQVRL